MRVLLAKFLANTLRPNPTVAAAAPATNPRCCVAAAAMRH